MEIDIAAIAACAATFFAAISFFKNIRDKRFDEIGKKIDIGFQRMDERFKEVHEEFKEVHREISDVKERLSFIEAIVFFKEASMDKNEHTFSERAKKAWATRKNRQIEKK